MGPPTRLPRWHVALRVNCGLWAHDGRRWAVMGSALSNGCVGVDWGRRRETGVRIGCAAMVDDAERLKEGDGERGTGWGESLTAYFNGYDLCNNRRTRLKATSPSRRPEFHLPRFISTFSLPLSHLPTSPFYPPKANRLIQTKQITTQIHEREREKTKKK